MRLTFLFASLLWGSVLFAQNPVDWKVLIHPLDSLAAGDTLTVSLGRQFEPGYSWKFAPDSASVKQWELLDPVVITDSTGFYRYDQQFIYWGIKPDTLRWQFSLYKDSDSVWYAIPELILYPKLVTEEGDTTLRPEKPIYTTLRPWWHYALWIGGGLLVIAGLIAWLLNRKNKRHGEDSPEDVLAIKPSPYEEFMTGMDALKVRRSDWMGDFSLYYANLVDLLKTYLEAVTGKPVREMTSWELNQWLSGEQRLKKVLPDMDLLLQRADLIKFARQTTMQEQMDADFADVLASVERIHTNRQVEESRLPETTKQVPGNQPEDLNGEPSGGH